MNHRHNRPFRFSEHGAQPFTVAHIGNHQFDLFTGQPLDPIKRLPVGIGKIIDHGDLIKPRSPPQMALFGLGSLGEVMIAANKSSLAFDATVQVRNKMVEAYKEVMSMPV